MSKRERQEDDEVEPESELDAAAQEDADAEFLTACRRGVVAEVQAALGKGASVNAIDGDYQTGLILACERESDEAVVPIVKLLLRKRSSVTHTPH
jgi:ankyrin repeat protein